MIWRGIGLLVGAATLVVVSVAALALVVVPDEPRFSDAVEEETGVEEDFVPDALGARLAISGARNDTVVLDDTVGGPTFGLGNSRTRIFFEGDPIAIGQMSHDGLAFFPEPDDCEFTPGEHNEDTGLVAVIISCPELIDIRGNGSISIEGLLALPADLVIELDLPERGGTVTIGNETISFGHDLQLFVGPSFDRGTSEMQLTAVSDSPRATLAFPYDLEADRLRLGLVAFSGGSTEIGPEDCSHQMSELAVINPQAKIVELTFSCPEIQLANVGQVPIEGTLVFEQIFFEG